MKWKGHIAPETWHQRFEAARTDLLDYRQVLDVRNRLVTENSPIVFGDAMALRRMGRVGIYSGAFNPQTIAHAAVAEAARAARRLDVVLWTLARVTVDKEAVVRANLADRVVQLRAYLRATMPHDAVAVTDAGLYVDQAEDIRSLVGPSCELWLIVGIDKVVQIFDARYYADRDATLRRLFNAAGLLVAPRAGQGEADLKAAVSEPSTRQFFARINLLPVAPEVASLASTDARRLMRTDVSTDQLTGLVTPEGAALGLVTGAYRDIEHTSGRTVADLYASRNAWLESMEHAP